MNNISSISIVQVDKAISKKGITGLDISGAIACSRL
jgi:hypothetical protein